MTKSKSNGIGPFAFKNLSHEIMIGPSLIFLPKFDEFQPDFFGSFRQKETPWSTDLKTVFMFLTHRLPSFIKAHLASNELLQK